MFDARANLVKSTVLAAPSPAASGTSFTYQVVDEPNFPNPATEGRYIIAFWPAAEDPNKLNTEFALVTAKSSNTLTIVRDQEDGVVRTILAGDNVAMVMSAGAIGDLSQCEWFKVTQVAHGFSALNSIYHNGTQWGKAFASAATTLATHVVGLVLNADTFIAVRSGKFTSAAHGLTPGSLYYTSSVTPGLLSTTVPPVYTNPIVFVESANELHVYGFQPQTVTTQAIQTLTNKTLTNPKINDTINMTASSTELNILDGASLSTAELNILDGVVATTAELNILSGVTANATELNYLDNVTPGTAVASKGVVLDANKDFNFGTGDITATIATLTSISAGFPGGFMINGKLVVSVASNNLTVALKGLDGNDPSATNPVYVRINNTIRAVTAALSVTKNAGTNYFNSGSSELSGKEVDYFVYLIWNTTPATAIVDIGFARIPHGYVYSDFSGTNTNEKYLAFGNASTPTSTDDLVVIGRFAATLTGTNWSVPTFTNKNLIQHPIFETRMLSWTPTTFSPQGGGSFTSTSITNAKYQISRFKLFINMQVAGTIAGTVNEFRIVGVYMTGAATGVQQVPGLFPGALFAKFQPNESGPFYQLTQYNLGNAATGSQSINLTGEHCID